MNMTTEELQAIREIVQEETRKIVQEETKKIVQEETRKIVREEQAGLDRRLVTIEGRSVITNNRLDHIENSLHVVGEKLDRLAWQMDVVYGWVDGIELDVKNLKKNA
jgi:hypothetical protein